MTMHTQFSFRILLVSLCAVVITGCGTLTISAPDVNADLLPSAVINFDNAPPIEDVIAIEFVKLIPSQKGNGDFPAMQNITWRLESFRTAGWRFFIQSPSVPVSESAPRFGLQPVPSSNPLALGKLTGSALSPCNSLWFTYTLTQTNLSVSGIAMTLVGCHSTDSKVEKLFLGGLTRIRSYSVQGDRLILLLQ